MTFEDSFIKGATTAAVPKDVRGTLELGRRGLALAEGELRVSGREVACITHARRSLPGWLH